jgi:hypothetical protein
MMRRGLQDDLHRLRRALRACWPVALVLLTCLVSDTLSSGCQFDQWSCHGTGDSCSFNRAEACTGEEGCYLGPRCNDNVCPTKTSQADCAQVGYCFWDPKITRCYASGGVCYRYATESACAADTSCAWGPGCLGTPVNCNNFATEAECKKHGLCYWDKEPSF